MGTKAYDNALDLITFSRASGGTALRKISYGSELVTNGTFDTDTSGWTAIRSSTLSSPSNNLRVTNAGGVTAGAAEQVVSTEVGKVYQISADFTYGGVTSGAIRIGTTSQGFQIANVSPYTANQTITYSFVATTTTTYIGLFNNAGTDGHYNEWDNISVKEVLFDQPDGTLTLFNHPNNIPRIDYAADGTVKGLLIEEARTNLVTYSQDFTDASWTKVNTAPLALDAIGPDGQTSAVTLVDSGATGAGSVYVQKSVTVANSTAYTFSCFAKADQLSWIRLFLSAFTTPANGEVYFDLSSGLVGTEDTGLTGNIEDFGNGWYRCSVTFITDAVDTLGILVIQAANSDGDVTVALDGTSSILIYGAQFERGSFPTSYIPTSGATATRSADIASIPVTDFGYNQKAGTVVVDYTEFHNYTASPYPRVLALTNGYSPREGLEILSFNNVGNAAGYVGGSSIFSFVGATSTKTAFSASENNFSASFAGGSVLTDTAGAMPSATLLELGKYSSAAFLNGHIKSIQYFPRRLSNAQLQELTS